MAKKARATTATIAARIYLRFAFMRFPSVLDTQGKENTLTAYNSLYNEFDLKKRIT